MTRLLDAAAVAAVAAAVVAAVAAVWVYHDWQEHSR